jgi:hypothetical protein
VADIVPTAAPVPAKNRKNTDLGSGLFSRLTRVGMGGLVGSAADLADNASADDDDEAGAAEVGSATTLIGADAGAPLVESGLVVNNLRNVTNNLCSCW